MPFIGHNITPKFVSIFIAAVAAVSTSACNRNESQPAVFTDYATRMSAAGVMGSQLLESDRDMRVSVMQQLKSAIVNHYANIELKNRRIKNDDGTPFDSVAHLDSCIDIESKTADTSDIKFIDRVKVCIAAFQDTHFGASSRTPMAGVSVGLILRNVGGRYVIAARQTDLLKYVAQISDESELEKVTAIGNEILEVDGQAPGAIADRLKKFINASSPAFRQLAADQAILSRSFDYPTKRNVTLKIKSPTKTYEYELPWWASIGARNRQDVSEYFQKVGIPTSDRVKMVLDADGKVDWKTVTLNYRGYLDSNPLPPADQFRPLVPFKANGGPIGARLGTVVTSSDTFCYAQLLTFSASTLSGPDGVEKPYLDVIKAFVKSCKAGDLNMVIDLRSNGGGNGSYPGKILALLAREKETLGHKVMAFRVNTTSSRLISSLLEHPEVAAKDLGDVGFRYFDELKAAADAGLTMTNAIPEYAGITADPEVGGYNGKILVLVTPNCISACDGMAAILKRTGRATILGTHTNGTGAGFQGSDTLDSGFQDTYDELAIKIPNYQFGYSPKPFATLAGVPYASVESEFFTENMPTKADIVVEPVFDDVMGKKSSWMDAVTKYLDETGPPAAGSTPASPAPAPPTPPAAPGPAGAPGTGTPTAPIP